MELSVVVPIYNEEQNLEVLYKKLNEVISGIGVSSHELIFVNDGSTDTSIGHILRFSQQDSSVRYIDFSRNFGHQIAVTAGLDKSSGNAVVIIDADLQDPPEVIGELYKKFKEGYEVVYAKRRTRKGENFMKKLTARVFYRVLSKITSVSIPVDTGDFRIVGRRVVEVLKKMPEQEKYLRGQIAWVGFKQTFVEYDRNERLAGKSGYTYRKMIRFAIDGITSFSNFPLKVATIAGFFVSGVAFILVVYALISYFYYNTTPGWTSLILSVLFLGGIQLIGIGIIGEYLGRVSNNVKNRPLYIVRDTNIDSE